MPIDAPTSSAGGAGFDQMTDQPQLRFAALEEFVLEEF